MNYWSLAQISVCRLSQRRITILMCNKKRTQIIHKWKLAMHRDAIICWSAIKYVNLPAISVIPIHYFSNSINLNHMHISSNWLYFAVTLQWADNRFIYIKSGVPRVWSENVLIRHTLARISRMFFGWINWIAEL